MIHRWLSLILTTILMGVMVGCSSPTPPIEFAPNGEIVEKAIALQLNQNFKPLSDQLNATPPQLEIKQIQVKQLDSILVEQLPTYHLKGTYNLKLILPRQKIDQKKNQFDIYLQRQIEGETWRLLRQDSKMSSQNPQWTSYLIK